MRRGTRAIPSNGRPARRWARAAAATAATAAAMTGVLGTAEQPAAHAATASPSWAGVYTWSGGTAQAAAFGSAEGAPVRWVTAFLTGGQGWSAVDDPSWYLAQWPASTGYQMDWSVPMLEASGDTLEQGAAGAFDAHFLNLARAFVAAGRTSVTFRLGWEMDGSFQPWYAGNDPAAYAAYWRRIVTIMRSVPGQQFRFDWNGGATSPSDPAYASYPGDAYVDYITNDEYDQSWDPAAGYSGNSASPAGYAQAWKDMSVSLAQLVATGRAHGKPIGLPEWGDIYRADGHGGGDDPYFMTQMYNWLATTPDVAFANYYDADNDGLHNLYGGRFPRAAAAWTAAVTSGASGPGTGQPSPPPPPPPSGPGSTGGSCASGTGQVPGPAVAIAATTIGGCRGYWVTTPYGTVASYGSAPSLGSLGGRLNAPIVGMAPTPDGHGYWLVGADGGVFSFGDAAFHGSTGGMRLNAPVIGMTSTSDGGGYWLFASDGGIFSFGDAQFHGSTGSLHLNAPVVGMAATPTGGGYILAAGDGGVFAFGDARFQGSAASLHLNAPVVGVSADPATGGYRMVARDGGVFDYGAAFYGSLGGSTGTVVTDMAPTTDGEGYYLLTQAGQVVPFGSAALPG